MDFYKIKKILNKGQKNVLLIDILRMLDDQINFLSVLKNQKLYFQI